VKRRAQATIREGGGAVLLSSRMCSLKHGLELNWVIGGSNVIF